MSGQNCLWPFIEGANESKLRRSTSHFGRGRREAPGEGRKSFPNLETLTRPLPEGEGESSAIPSHLQFRRPPLQRPSSTFLFKNRPIKLGGQFMLVSRQL